MVVEVTTRVIQLPILYCILFMHNPALTHQDRSFTEVFPANFLYSGFNPGSGMGVLYFSTQDVPIPKKRSGDKAEKLHILVNCKVLLSELSNKGLLRVYIFILLID